MNNLKYYIMVDNINYNISQAALYKITNSIVSISFEIKNKKNLTIKVYNLIGITLKEQGLMKDFEKELQSMLAKYIICFEFKEISEEDFNNLEIKTLEHKFFLRYYNYEEKVAVR